MSVDLRWDGTRLMLGTLAIATINPATATGAGASYQLAGHHTVAVTVDPPEGSARTVTDVATERARNHCETAARRALRAAGVEVEP